MTSLLILNTPENQKASIKTARGKQTKHTGTSQICKNTTIYIHKKKFSALPVIKESHIIIARVKQLS